MPELAEAEGEEAREFMADAGISLQLTRAESLVLFEWLAKLDASDSLPCEHAAEEKVLWHLQAQLEKTLVEPFMPNYNEVLAEARRRVVEGEPPFAG